MSNNEIEKYLNTLEQGLAEAEKLMLQEKANRGESVINSDENGNIIRVPASEIIEKYPQFQ